LLQCNHLSNFVMCTINTIPFLLEHCLIFFLKLFLLKIRSTTFNLFNWFFYNRKKVLGKEFNILSFRENISFIHTSLNTHTHTGFFWSIYLLENTKANIFIIVRSVKEKNDYTFFKIFLTVSKNPTFILWRCVISSWHLDVRMNSLNWS
jgi:hypothetical protein